MDEHISKPFDSDEFLRTVRRSVAGSQRGWRERADPTPSLERDAPDIDDAHLEGLARLLPADRFSHMLEVYLQGARERLQRIQLLALDHDFKGLVGEAHDLKSTSGNLGARRLQHLAERLEAAGRSQDAGAVSAMLPELDRASAVAWGIMSRRRDRANCA